MDEKSYLEALNELEHIFEGRKEISDRAESCIDRYIKDRSLPLEYKDKCVEWEQEIIDLLEKQLSEAKEMAKYLKSKTTKTDE